ncbi:MAG: hypothetical protein QOG08_1643 [Chloroflexota bacterium]|jgi:hypothetical protein|nr:hypothetical protein [Chloroflexota bacterium]
MSEVKSVRRVKVADDDLDLGIREVLEEMRAALGPYGWMVHAERRGDNFSFEFRNPLSTMASGIHFDSHRSPAELRKQLDDHVSSEPEYAQTRLVDPPRRKRQLLGGLRYAANWYGWSDRVFQEIIDTLVGHRVLSKEEGTWLTAVGPGALSDDVRSGLAKHRKAERRRRTAANARKAR